MPAMCGEEGRGQRGQQGGLRSPPAREPCRVLGSTVTKLLLPRPWFPHSSASGSATAWAGVRTCDSPSCQHTPTFSHIHVYRHRKGPITSTPHPPLPTSNSQLLGAGAQLAPPGRWPEPACASCPAQRGWDVPPGAWCWAAVATAPRPQPTRKRPAPAQGQSACSGCDLRPVGRVGVQGHQGGGTSRARRLREPWGLAFGQAPDSPRAICCPPLPTHLRPWGGQEAMPSERGAPQTRGRPEAGLCPARWSTLTHPHPDTAPSSGGW